MTDQSWRPSAARRKRRRHSIARIDMAGLGGIMLFFVVLFMLPAMLAVNNDLPVRGSADLPLAAHLEPEPGALKEDAIEITVSRDEHIYVCGAKVLPDDISDQILQRVKQGSEHKVYLRGDLRAKYGVVKVVIDKIRNAGIDNIAIMVETPRPEHTP